MSIPMILAVVALALGIIELFRSQGQALIAWAVVLLAVAHLWGVLT